MKITELRFHFEAGGPLLAAVNITFDTCFVVRARIVSVKGRTMLVMPSRKMPAGDFKDVCHPINAEFRAYLEREVFAAYEKEKPKAEAAHA